MKTSTDHMAYGLITAWLSILAVFFGVAVLFHGHAFGGYLILALATLGLLRASRHMRESLRLAALEDARDYADWAASASQPSTLNSQPLP